MTVGNDDDDMQKPYLIIISSIIRQIDTTQTYSRAFYNDYNYKPHSLQQSTDSVTTIKKGITGDGRLGFK